MNEKTLIKKFRIHSSEHERISIVLESSFISKFERDAILEKLFRHWKIKNLDDEMQDLLIDLEKDNNPHYSEYGDFFAYFEDEEVMDYLHTYEDEFIEYFKNNKDLCYDR